MLMMCGGVVFAGVVGQIFKPWRPHHRKISFIYLVAAIKITHLHHARALPFHCAVDDADRRLVIAADGCWWLRMPQLLKGKAYYAPLPHVEEERAKLRLSR